MADALVTYAVTDVHIARITLDAPARRNALSDAMLDQLIGACERARDDDEVRVVVIGTSHEPRADLLGRRRSARSGLGLLGRREVCRS